MTSLVLNILNTFHAKTLSLAPTYASLQRVLAFNPSVDSVVLVIMPDVATELAEKANATERLRKRLNKLYASLQVLNDCHTQ